jgi:hypothetical protein
MGALVILVVLVVVIVSVLAYPDAFCNLLVIKAVLSIHEVNVINWENHDLLVCLDHGA